MNRFLKIMYFVYAYKTVAMVKSQWSMQFLPKVFWAR